MALKIWLSAIAIALVPAALGISTDVPNQCPAVPGEFPVFYVHPDNCQYYFMCDHGTPMLKKCDDGTRWSDVYKTCVKENTLYDTCTIKTATPEDENPQLQCSQGATGLIPHPTSCQGYYNCSDTEPRPVYSRLGQYEDECPYPDLFDLNEKKCEPYNEAYCGPDRVAAKEPCAYLTNWCPFIGRCPCTDIYPSCVGFPDGFNEHRQRLWSPYYVLCKDERLVWTSTELFSYSAAWHRCEEHKLTNTPLIFSPVKKACVTVWEVPRQYGGFAPTCDGKASGRSYQSDKLASVYYSCPDLKVSFCALGDVFNETTQKCESSK